jgi:hypothetical protein
MGNTTNGNGSVEHWTLRDQVLDYGTVFTAGLAVAATIGFLVGIMFDVAVPSAIGSAIVFLGVVCLLSAGLTGGQYAIGGVGRGAARHNFAKGDGNNALIEELSHGYRPEKDPIAFWFAIGGILYVAVGFVILVAGS